MGKCLSTMIAFFCGCALPCAAAAPSEADFARWRAALESRAGGIRSMAVSVDGEIVYRVHNEPYAVNFNLFPEGEKYDLDEVSELVLEPGRRMKEKFSDPRPLDQVIQYRLFREIPHKPTLPYWSWTRGVQMRLDDLCRLGEWYLSDRALPGLRERFPLGSGVGALGRRGQMLLVLPEAKASIAVLANAERAGEVLAVTEDTLVPKLLKAAQVRPDGHTYALEGAPNGWTALSLAEADGVYDLRLRNAHGVFRHQAKCGEWKTLFNFADLPTRDFQRRREATVRIRPCGPHFLRVDLVDVMGAYEQTMLLAYDAKGMDAKIWSVPDGKVASVRGKPCADLVPHDATTESFGARHEVLCLRPDAVAKRHSEGDAIRLKDGRMLLAWTRLRESHDDNAPGEIWQCHSSDDGRTWSEERLLFGLRPGELSLMEVNLLRLSDGDLAALYLAKHSDLYQVGAATVVYFLRSKDEGETWSEPVRVVPADAKQGWYVIANGGGRLVQMRTGRLVVPMAFGGDIVFSLSDDGGKTWRLSPNSAADYLSITGPDGCDSRMEEPTVAELSDGRLMAYARTSLGSQYRAYSSDGGETWTPFEPGPLASPGATGTLKRLANGRLAAAWNDMSGSDEIRRMCPWHNGWRKPLTIAFSDDDGATWRDHVKLETEGWCCMAFIAETKDALLVGYCIGDALDTLRVARIPHGDLKVPNL